MKHMGHTSASLTLEVYARDMDDDGELGRLQALVGVDNAQQPVAGRHPIGNRAHSGVESEHA
jgi:hypothetical protein